VDSEQEANATKTVKFANDLLGSSSRHYAQLALLGFDLPRFATSTLLGKLRWERPAAARSKFSSHGDELQ